MTSLAQQLYNESKDNPDSLEWQAAFRIERQDAAIKTLRGGSGINQAHELQRFGTRSGM